ncbi:hypothetical protein SLEP1_g53339 [Rubroshorea leprosula]|uniref:Thaumatin-like protein n=1 Tax=Rubroshorea leprosula TaxID=152421 RepID=A0AAV5M9A1_9ROSI|nr:hypothetical protein SLEP1_g53339 [Rubroshorea leprosula]
MENPGILILTLVISTLLHGAQSSTFTFKNNCPVTVWPATLTGSGASLSSTGFELPTGASNSLNVIAPWSGRMWARSGCTNSDGKFQCATGDCASGQVTCNGAGPIPPESLVEFSIAANGGQDFYDVSLVDGFNVPLSITPQGGDPGCNSTSCPMDINKVCPPELQVVVGTVMGCKSACVAFNQPQYCCTGAYGSPETCPPTKYSQFFKSQCPQAYSYAFDDKTSTFTCTGGANFLITFCP